MKRLHLAMFIIIFGAIPTYSQDYLKQMKTLFDNRYYDAAFNYGVSEIGRLSKINTRNLYLEFLTYASLASLSDQNIRKSGCGQLEDYLKHNRRHFEDWNTWSIVSAKTDSLCSRNINVRTAPLLDYNTNSFSFHETTNEGGGYLGANFKTYKLLHENTRGANFFARISEDDFDKLMSPVKKTSSTRIIPTGRTSRPEIKILPKDATNTDVADYVRVAYDSANWYKSSNFLVTSHHKKRSSLQRTGTQLEKVLKFYITQLKLPPNNQLICVYLSASYTEPVIDIFKIYGRDVFSSILGFTDMQSKSVVAWLPGDTLVGTIKHELIHILLFNNNRLIPAWFEEGLAALYEESRFVSATSLKGIKNWRKNFIDGLGDSLARKLFNGLLMGNDSLMSEVESEIGEQVKILQQNAQKQNHYSIFKDKVESAAKTLAPAYLQFSKDAMSRYIVYYYQSLGQLDNLIASLLANGSFHVQGSSYVNFEENLLKHSSSKSLAEFRTKFFQWVAKQK